MTAGEAIALLTRDATETAELLEQLEHRWIEALIAGTASIADVEAEATMCRRLARDVFCDVAHKMLELRFMPADQEVE